MDTLEAICYLVAHVDSKEYEVKVTDPALEPEFLVKQIDEMFRGAVKLTWSAFLAPTEEEAGWVKVKLEFGEEGEGSAKKSSN